MNPSDAQTTERFASAVDAMQKLETVTLRSLWLAAADASDVLADASGPSASGITDDAYRHIERAAQDAEQALRDFLLTEHGLTTADLRRSVL